MATAPAPPRGRGCDPRRRARASTAASSCSSRVLPTPGSPSTTTTALWPPWAAAAARWRSPGPRCGRRSSPTSRRSGPDLCRHHAVTGSARPASSGGAASTSCRSTAVSSCRNRGPGSIPSSSARTARTRRSAASASACRADLGVAEHEQLPGRLPQRVRPRRPPPWRRSRQPRGPGRAAARPARRRRVSRSSSTRAISDCAHSACRTSAYVSPRQSASAAS